MATTETVKFFTYGTLRRGGALHEWVEGRIIKDLGEATIPRTRLYFPAGHKGFPYLMTGTPGFAAKGEVYEIPLDRETTEMFNMETNAGYSIEELEAIFEDGTAAEVVVCTMSRGIRVGEPVPENDWMSREKEKWWT